MGQQGIDPCITSGIRIIIMVILLVVGRSDGFVYSDGFGSHLSCCDAYPKPSLDLRPLHIFV
jgi:hypothetical protein